MHRLDPLIVPTGKVIGGQDVLGIVVADEEAIQALAEYIKKEL